MNTNELRALATAALDVIERQKPGAAWAGRRGISAGASCIRKYTDLVFRRIDGGVRMEAWRHHYKAGDKVTLHDLPADLEARAAAALDRC